MVNLRYDYKFSVSNVRRTFRGTGSLSYLGPKMWDIVPEELKEFSNKGASKKLLKCGNLKIATDCSLCRELIPNLGFI